MNYKLQVEVFWIVIAKMKRGRSGPAAFWLAALGAPLQSGLVSMPFPPILATGIQNSVTFTTMSQKYAGSRQKSYKNHENVRNIWQSEAQHGKFKRLKLGGGQSYDCSSV
jgi:hypothetical protein